jgi:hypothetical protein
MVTAGDDLTIDIRRGCYRLRQLSPVKIRIQRQQVEATISRPLLAKNSQPGRILTTTRHATQHGNQMLPKGISNFRGFSEQTNYPAHIPTSELN